LPQVRVHDQAPGGSLERSCIVEKQGFLLRFGHGAVAGDEAHGPTRKGIGVLGKSTERGVNLALGKIVSASSLLRCHGPGQVVNGCLGMRWLVGDTKAAETWRQVDLGSGTQVGRTEISFNYPTELTPHVVQYSLDGQTWRPYADHTKDTIYESPKVDRRSVSTRYLHVLFPVAVTNGIPAGIREFKAFAEER
jgi:hypothetical protein